MLYVAYVRYYLHLLLSTNNYIYSYRSSRFSSMRRLYVLGEWTCYMYRLVAVEIALPALEHSKRAVTLIKFMNFDASK